MMNQLRLTPVVLRLLILNVAITFFFAIFKSNEFIADIFFDYFLLWKIDILQYNPGNMGRSLFHPVQLVSHFFSHSLSDMGHLLFNMLSLIFFGPFLEEVLRSKRFLRFYLFCGLVGGLLVTLFDPSPNPVLGASGALFGVGMAFAFYAPEHRISLLFLPFSFKARELMIGLTVISAAFVLMDVADIDGGQGNISHFGHLSGVAAAALYFQIEKYLPFKD
ncbi:MAG: rhomboid family intramembrane serine protease [Bacteroidia bacterium]|nr:rhomboid family intramembrane serine protease [Bacteroidia bacterium]